MQTAFELILLGNQLLRAKQLPKCFLERRVLSMHSILLLQRLDIYYSSPNFLIQKMHKEGENEKLVIDITSEIFDDSIAAVYAIIWKRYIILTLANKSNIFKK